jgi:hypothetical protein
MHDASWKIMKVSVLLSGKLIRRTFKKWPIEVLTSGKLLAVVLSVVRGVALRVVTNVSEEHIVSIFRVNVGNHLQDDTASQPNRPQ